jgi:hypothetical protein
MAPLAADIAPQVDWAAEAFGSGPPDAVGPHTRSRPTPSLLFPF